MHSLKEDLFSAGMYVFTPKGDLLTFRRAPPLSILPTGFIPRWATAVPGRASTASWFRSNIFCAAATRWKSSRHQQQVPTRDWLKWVKTPRAKSKIRNWLKSQQHETQRGPGPRNPRRRLASLSIRFSVSSRQRQDRLGQPKSSASKTKKLCYRRIGYGRITTRHVLVKLVPPDKLDSGAKRPTARWSHCSVSSPRRSAVLGIRVKGVDDVLVRFALVLPSATRRTISLDLLPGAAV